MLNDLKRDVASAASELRISEDMIASALLGDERALQEVTNRASALWPVSTRDFAVVRDDAPDLTITWTAEQSYFSSRILARGGQPYYEYRDTAMSALSPTRPEWIRALARTPRCDPMDPVLKWNRGHSLHQLTYFLGNVDFYYEEDGVRVGQAMENGDSAYIPAWVPHTFAARNGVERATILAVTYRGRLTGDVIEDLAVACTEMEQNDLPFQASRAQRFSKILAAFMNDALLSRGALAAGTRLPSDRIDAFLIGHVDPNHVEIAAIAAVLGVSERDLDPGHISQLRVEIHRASDSHFNEYPSVSNAAYRARALTQTGYSPNTRGIEIEVLEQVGSWPEHMRMRTGLHQYGYILGERPVVMAWWRGERYFEIQLDPGDSFYMKPWTTHAFGLIPRVGDLESAYVLSFRCAGAFGGDALRELAMLGSASASKFTKQQSTWYE